MFRKVRCKICSKISLGQFCLLPYGTWEFKSFTLSSVCEKVASGSGYSQTDEECVTAQTGVEEWIEKFILCSIVSREILMYNLTHRLQVVVSSTIKKIAVTDNTGLPEPTGSPASRVSDLCMQPDNWIVCMISNSECERADKKHIWLSDRFSWQTE